MINTDKYKGHTEGPWVWDDLHSSGKEMLFVHRKGNDNDIIANVNGVINGKLECANAQLIADAPLLLEEVKELQAWKKLMVRVVNDLRCDLTMMRLDDNHQPQFEDAVRAATKTLSEVIDVD